jgi:hypothetical protein
LILKLNIKGVEIIPTPFYNF